MIRSRIGRKGAVEIENEYKRCKNMRQCAYLRDFGSVRLKASVTLSPGLSCIKAVGGAGDAAAEETTTHVEKKRAEKNDLGNPIAGNLK